MRPITRLLATLLAALNSSTASIAQPTSSPVPLSFLPPEQVFPLVGEQCGCATFRKGAALVDEAVIFSGTPNLGHIRVASYNYELKHVNRKVVGKDYFNTFAAAGTRVSLTTTEVPFERACSAYPDPPPHGSCFIGTMHARVGKRSTSMQVVQVCGC
jgi:hypothetical protein